MVTMSKTKLDSAARSLWWLLPDDLRLKLNARTPLDAKTVESDSALVCAVGSGVPLKWLLLAATDKGFIRCHVWEVTAKGNKTLAEEVVPATNVEGLLKVWSNRYI